MPDQKFLKNQLHNPLLLHLHGHTHLWARYDEIVMSTPTRFTEVIAPLHRLIEYSFRKTSSEFHELSALMAK